MRDNDRPDSMKPTSHSGEEGSAQRVLLLLLLLLVALFGYLYFFTGLIKPREEASSPVDVATVEKKPLPPRPATGEGAKEPVQPAAPAEAPVKTDGKAAPPAVEKGPSPGIQSQQSPQTKEPAPPPTTAAVKKQGTDPGVQKPAASAPAAKETQKPSAPKAPRPDDREKKKSAATVAAPAKEAASKKKAGAAYALLVGEYVLEGNLKGAQQQLKKYGISTFNVSRQTRPAPMHRLRAGEFATRSEAEVELKKVQKLSGSSFILPVGGKYAVYVGSYADSGKAARETERLSGSGLSITLEKAEVSVPVKRLTAGAFPDKASADAEAGRLKKKGIKTAVVPLSKASR